MSSDPITDRAVPPPSPVPLGMAVVARRIDISAARLADLLGDASFAEALFVTDLAGRGRLALDGPFEAVGGEALAWRVTGRLHFAGPRVVAYARVRLSIVAWSADAVELQIRPVCPDPFRWGRRRLRRYFDLVHRAGDELRRVFTSDHAAAVRPVCVGCAVASFLAGREVDELATAVGGDVAALRDECGELAAAALHS